MPANPYIAPNGKKIFAICQSYTDGTVGELRALVYSGAINREDYTSARLDYNCDEGCPNAMEDGADQIPENFPLKFKGKKSEIWCSAVSGGYRGQGPHGTLECLKLMGFELSEKRKEDVFTKKDAHLVFRRAK